MENGDNSGAQNDNNATNTNVRTTHHQHYVQVGDQPPQFAEWHFVQESPNNQPNVANVDFGNVPHAGNIHGTPAVPVLIDPVLPPNPHIPVDFVPLPHQHHQMHHQTNVQQNQVHLQNIPAHMRHQFAHNNGREAHLHANRNHVHNHPHANHRTFVQPFPPHVNQYNAEHDNVLRVQAAHARAQRAHEVHLRRHARAYAQAQQRVQNMHQSEEHGPSNIDNQLHQVSMWRHKRINAIKNMTSAQVMRSSESSSINLRSAVMCRDVDWLRSWVVSTTPLAAATAIDQLNERGESHIIACITAGCDASNACLRLLLRTKANPNVEDVSGQQAIHKAVMLWDSASLKILLDAKADAASSFSSEFGRRCLDRSMLHMQPYSPRANAYSSQKQILRSLVDAKVDFSGYRNVWKIHVTQNLPSPLSGSRLFDVIETLLNLGADPLLRKIM